MGFVSGLTLAGCDESESRTKSYADLEHHVGRLVGFLGRVLAEGGARK